MVEPNRDSDVDSDEEEEEVQISPEQKNKMLMDAVKNNDFDGVVEATKIGADVTHEVDGWNPLLWAACNGNEDIVRHLIKFQAHFKYKEQVGDQNANDNDEGEPKDNFQPVPDPAKTGRHTPMHWASYHGHCKVVWLLMKEKMNPLL